MSTGSQTEPGKGTGCPLKPLKSFKSLNHKRKIKPHALSADIVAKPAVGFHHIILNVDPKNFIKDGCNEITVFQQPSMEAPMEGRTEETCKDMLSQMLSLPRGSDLTPHIDHFRQFLWNGKDSNAKGDRIATIFLELATDLDLYEHDPIICQENPHLVGDDLAIEKIRETLEALQNISTVMPWLRRQ